MKRDRVDLDLAVKVNGRLLSPEHEAIPRCASSKLSRLYATVPCGS